VEGERKRIEKNISGQFRVADANTLELETNNYDLIFSCHSFHHFLELEYIMQQVSQALTDRGVFILEEYVGPTQFQWTDEQIDLVKSLLALAPPELRMYRFNTLKVWEGRPTIEQVTAESPFESIRSANILPLFKQHFQIIVAKPLGGTIQQLLYNGIIHNFRPEDEQACNYIEAVIDVENALVNAGILPSDFMLLIGKRINI
jgi:SAM-dependent methyltransferase